MAVGMDANMRIPANGMRGPYLSHIGIEEEMNKDGSSNTNNVGGPELLLIRLECLLDFTEEWRSGEPNEESDEETRPGKVKRSHMRAGEVAQLDLCGTALLERIHIASISLVWLGRVVNLIEV
jgi:hypothetical protein